MAAEKLNPPRPSPLWSLTMPNRFGPTRLGPPFSKVWQAPHFFAAAAPFSTDAVCNSFSIGSDRGGAAFLAPLSTSLTAMSQTRLSRLTRGDIAPAAQLLCHRNQQRT